MDYIIDDIRYSRAIDKILIASADRLVIADVYNLIPEKSVSLVKSLFSI